MTDRDAHCLTQALIIHPRLTEIASRPLLTRILFDLCALGIERVVFWPQIHLPARSLPEAIRVCPTADLRQDELLLVLRGDMLVDPRLIAQAIKQRPSIYRCQTGLGATLAVAVVSGGAVAAAQGDPDRVFQSVAALPRLATVQASDIDSYSAKLRRCVRPYCLPVLSAADVRRAERALLEASEKDPSDLVAKYVHRPLENWAVVRLAATSMTPHGMTVAINVMAYGVTVLYATGHLLGGSLLSLLVGLCDGLDGKLARFRGRATKLGALEHAFDFLFESSWIIALAYHLSRVEATWLPLLLAAIFVTLTGFYRSLYDRFGQLTGRSLDVYDKFGGLFRRVAGRRNLYNLHVLVTVLTGRPGVALYSLTVHAGVTAFVYAARAVWHLRRV